MSERIMGESSSDDAEIRAKALREQIARLQNLKNVGPFSVEDEADLKDKGEELQRLETKL